MGINISVGEIEKILRDVTEQFKSEKEDILDAAMHCSAFVQTDDTGARHAGKNGFCKVIGNDLFAYYASTASKSRMNFLKILQGKNTDKTLTEGVMIGSLFHHGIPKDIVLVSDDAKQFNLFIHSPCWAHAIRNSKKVIASDDDSWNEADNVLTSICEYYKKLKGFSIASSQEVKATLWLEFDNIATTDVNNPALKKALMILHENKAELLRVLDCPFIPLTNNGSERDIRSYITKRKISDGTRSESGHKARDTFTSLSTTCRKLKISFWYYLEDRLRKTNKIPELADVIRQKYRSASAP